MRNEKFSARLTFVMAIVSAFAFLAVTSAAAQEKLLHSFNNNGVNSPYGPFAGLTFDTAGNLYGTTEQGGPSQYGTVFELTPTGTGGWTEKTLHNFSGRDGVYPLAGVIADASGNLYGTTAEGGGRTCPGTSGCGLVFALTRSAEGTWTEKVLYNFGANANDGYGSVGGLVFDAAGNLFGTTESGGAGTGCTVTYGCGTVFELMPQSDGSWTEKIVHRFAGTDGANPSASLLFDASGNLYGTAGQGGTHAWGTVFELSPQSGGNWTDTVLYNFGSVSGDGLGPQGNLVLDGAGHLYGAASLGGAYGGGTVYELTPITGGAWTEASLHSFNGKGGKDGASPVAGLVMDAAGNLYGTTSGGGRGETGTVFELSPSAGGSWTEAILHNFASNGKDGIDPQAGLVLDAAGNLYGTTSEGGAYDNGIAFEIIH